MALAGTEPLQLSHDLLIEWRESRLQVARSLSRGPVPIGVTTVALLDLFREPRIPGEAVETFCGGIEDAAAREEVRSTLGGLIEKLSRLGVLVPVGGATVRAGRSWFGDLDVHVTMLGDYVRTGTYRRAIERHVGGKVVVEVGTGTGILSCFAVLAGAKHVYAIEETPIVEMAREVAAANGLEDRITFIAGHSRDVDIPERGDVLISELLGTDPLGEGMIASLADATKRFLTTEGVAIPRRIDIWAIGIESERLLFERAAIDARTQAASALSDLHNVDLGPLVTRYEEYLEQRFWRTPYYGDLGIDLRQERPAAKLLTGPQLVREIDLLRTDDDVWETNVELECRQGGTLNAAAFYFAAWLDDETILTTSPYPLQRPVSWSGQAFFPLEEISVSPGDRLPCRVAFSPATAPRLKFEVSS